MLDKCKQSNVNIGFVSLYCICVGFYVGSRHSHFYYISYASTLCVWCTV